MISDKESATVFTVVSLCHDSSYSSYLQDFVFVLCYQQFVYGGFCVFQKNFVLCMICVCVCDFYISILISVPFTLQKLLPIFPQVLVSALLFFISFWDSNDLLRILVLTYRPWKLYLIFKNIFLFVLQLVLTSIEMYIYIYTSTYTYIYIYIYETKVIQNKETHILQPLINQLTRLNNKTATNSSERDRRGERMHKDALLDTWHKILNLIIKKTCSGKSSLILISRYLCKNLKSEVQYV